MGFLLLSGAAFLVSGLTLFSGFGLSTLLLPLFALSFPVPLAVALTAIVHFLNNLFKWFLWGGKADRWVVFKFGVPALLSAFLGAEMLLWFSDLKPLISYDFFGRQVNVLPVKLMVGLLMVFFALFEILPRLKNISFDEKYLPLGGIMSGFFGGLSGHQGALRSAFLVRCHLSKEAFIGSGVFIACLVDFSRLLVYGVRFAGEGIKENLLLLTAVTLFAFIGAWMGSRLVHQVTLRFIQRLVGFLLLGIAVGLGSGLL